MSDAGTEKKIKLFTGLDKISGRCPLAGREWGGEGVIDRALGVGHSKFEPHARPSGEEADREDTISR